jgi:uncharacterized protein (TIGR03435 family)
MEGRLTIVAALVLAVSAGAFGQTFEVASIKPARPSTDGRLHTRFSVDSARLLYANVSLRDIMKQAFHVQDQQVTGPEWIATDRFDITAKMPAAVGRDRVPQMLQALLAERFGLLVHRQTKNMSRYSLAAEKNGSRLRKTESASGITTNIGRGCNRWSGQATMTQLTDSLAQQLGAPVADNTGLDGAFQIALDWASDSGNDGDSCGPSLMTSLQEQLGLKLSAEKGPVEILVIDHIDRTPTEN